MTVSGLSGSDSGSDGGQQHGDISGAVYTALSAERFPVMYSPEAAVRREPTACSIPISWAMITVAIRIRCRGRRHQEPTPTPTPTPTSLTQSDLMMCRALPTKTIREIKGKVRPVVDSPSLAVGYRSDYDILQSVSGGIKLPTEAGILHTTAQPQGSTVVVRRVKLLIC